jgi:hypothetical protein
MMGMRFWRRLAALRVRHRSVRWQLAAQQVILNQCVDRLDGWDRAASVTAAGRHRKQRHLKAVRSEAG